MGFCWNNDKDNKINEIGLGRSRLYNKGNFYAIAIGGVIDNKIIVNKEIMKFIFLYIFIFVFIK